ncbi:MAG: CDP-6-deoxy-delta-3,4-glucoseen reductase [Pseudolabrys sp.]|nr:CDP-6-deoxy-delta-3,4-glucoseen reductase [Pseudolabrys sp.]
MSFRVTLKASGAGFDVADGKSVLQAGLDEGVALPYSCRGGACATCRATILEGQVNYGIAFETHLSAADKAKGYVLLCCATPLSDLVIDVTLVDTSALLPPKVCPSRLIKIDRPAADVAVLTLRLHPNDDFKFAPGQYIDLLLEGGARRSYSIATAPKLEGLTRMELHVRHTPGGLFTDALFGGAVPEGKVLRFEGPLGTFFLREQSDKPIIYLASGTGFAPLKAIIEYAKTKRIARPAVLYWGCRSLADLYMLDLAQSWASKDAGDDASFRFVPVLSEPKPEDRWCGRSGFVHAAVMADFPDLSGHQVYACGAPPMVDAARRDFVAACGLPADEFFADAFITEADRAGA